MGILNLLKNLSDFSTSLNIKKLRHKKAAIDVYGWIHRGLYLSASEVLDGKTPKKFLSLIDNYVLLLQLNNIEPYLILDGAKYPFKAETDLKRSESRGKARQSAFDIYQKSGKKSEAIAILRTCMTVTREVHDLTVEHCKQKNYKYLVAPFECDAQLAYLYKYNFVDFVISEDSDLLVFGVNKLLTKLTSDGDGVLVDITNVFTENKENVKSGLSSRTKKLINLNFNEFMSVCALTGCDYIPNKVRNVGFVKGLDFVQGTNGDITKISENILEAEKYEIPSDFPERFNMALLSWKHHPVYCLEENKIKPLNKIEENDEKAKEFWEKFDLNGIIIEKDLEDKELEDEVEKREEEHDAKDDDEFDEEDREVKKVKVKAKEKKYKKKIKYIERVKSKSSET